MHISPYRSACLEAMLFMGKNLQFLSFQSYQQQANKIIWNVFTKKNLNITKLFDKIGHGTINT
jgi:hypothetical protein